MKLKAKHIIIGVVLYYGWMAYESVNAALKVIPNL